jgi:hypothetical protein
MIRCILVLKRVCFFSKEICFEKGVIEIHFLTWVPTFTPSEPPGICIWIRMCTYVCMSACVRMYVCLLRVYVHVCARACVCANMCVCACVFVVCARV